MTWTGLGFFFFFFFLGYMGIVHPPSADEGTERTWFEPEQRLRKRVPKGLGWRQALMGSVEVADGGSRCEAGLSEHLE